MCDYSKYCENTMLIVDSLVKADSTYIVERAAGDGRILRVFPSKGYPIPADTQLTNPEKISCEYNGTNSGYHCGTIKQIDPHGVFSSSHTDATYAFEIIPETGKTVLYYSEAKLQGYAYPVRQNGAFTVERVSLPAETVYTENKLKAINEKMKKAEENYQKSIKKNNQS
jgi:hypothetical protein